MIKTSARLYRNVADQIAAEIRAGTLVPGTRLAGERALAEKYGVSRPTVREAIIALETLGMVTVTHGSGILVTNAGPDGCSDVPARQAKSAALYSSMLEMLEAALVLECGAINMACATPDTDRLAEMSQVLKQITPDPQYFSSAGVAFHLAVARATGNPTLIDMVERIWDDLSSLGLPALVSQAEARQIAEPSLEAFKQVLDGLRHGDADKARDGIRQHFECLRDLVWAADEQEEMERLKQKQKAVREALSRRTPNWGR